MQLQNFDVEHIANLVTHEVRGSSVFYNLDQAKTYLISCLFKCRDKGEFFYCAHEDGEIYIIKQEAITPLFNIMGDELRKWFKSYPATYKITCDIKAPLVNFTSKLINKSGVFMHQKYKPFEEYDEETKADVEFFLSYMKEVLCSNKQDQYKYLEKWTAYMCQGFKNKTLLYLKSIQGVGKSHFPEILRDFVLGEGICDELDTEALETKYNAIMCGKLMVWFEEVSLMAPTAWAKVSDKLKCYATSTKLRFEQKNFPAFTAPNISNVMVLSNHPCIKEAEGRRVLVLDVSVERQEDKAYFAELRRRCFNKKVGEAIFSYFQTIDASDIDMCPLPMSNAKKDAFASRLRAEYKFLKEMYIFNKKGIEKVKLREITNEYNEWAQNNGEKKLKTSDFDTAMSEIRINRKHAKGYWYYNISYADLLGIANKKHWIHELDEFNEDEDKNQDPEMDVYDENQMLKQQNKELEKRLKELEKQLALSQQQNKYEKVIDVLATKLSIENILQENARIDEYIKECEEFPYQLVQAVNNEEQEEIFKPKRKIPQRPAKFADQAETNIYETINYDADDIDDCIAELVSSDSEEEETDNEEDDEIDLNVTF